jgi:anti-sigma regulatory factor (Ser/Thr protein kinase)
MRLEPLTPAVAGRARAAIKSALTKAGLEHLTETAELLGSELVTNALLHGVAPARMVVYEDSGLLFIEVHDAAVALPRPEIAAADAEGGRGLAIVEALAEDWDTDPTNTGKCVWASLAVCPQEARPSRCVCGRLDDPAAVLERVNA